MGCSSYARIGAFPTPRFRIITAGRVSTMVFFGFAAIAPSGSEVRLRMRLTVVG
jgi:hypothetical protein